MRHEHLQIGPTYLANQSLSGQEASSLPDGIREESAHHSQGDRSLLRQRVDIFVVGVTNMGLNSVHMDLDSLTINHYIYEIPFREIIVSITFPEIRITLQSL